MLLFYGFAGNLRHFWSFTHRNARLISHGFIVCNIVDKRVAKKTNSLILICQTRRTLYSICCLFFAQWFSGACENISAKEMLSQWHPQCVCVCVLGVSFVAQSCQSYLQSVCNPFINNVPTETCLSSAHKTKCLWTVAAKNSARRIQKY